MLCSSMITQCRRQQKWQAPRPICISKLWLNSPAICKRAQRCARQHATAMELLWQMRLPFPTLQSQRQLVPGFSQITKDKIVLGKKKSFKRSYFSLFFWSKKIFLWPSSIIDSRKPKWACQSLLHPHSLKRAEKGACRAWGRFIALLPSVGSNS